MAKDGPVADVRPSEPHLSNAIPRAEITHPGHTPIHRYVKYNCEAVFGVEKLLAGDWGPDSKVRPSGVVIEDQQAVEAFKSRRQRIEKFESEEFSHHRLADLRRSANEGCQLCLQVWFSYSEKERQRRHEEHGNGLVDEQKEATVDVNVLYPDLGNEVLLLWKIASTDSKYEIEVIRLDSISPMQTFESNPPGNDSGNTRSRSTNCIREWIRSCNAEHLQCTQWRRDTKDASFRLPSRLLRLQNHQPYPVVTLQETSRLQGDTEYATVSHAWGAEQPVRLLKANYQQFLTGIDFSVLPITFQEAITVSIELGIEYLWIDSLCIVQDSMDDWLAEASRMSTVYTKSWLNIAATASRDCHGGLFHGSQLGKMGPISATWNVFPGHFSHSLLDQWEKQIEYGPLNRRAWVIQERVLFLRTVHFARDQVWWSCRSLPRACESFPSGAPQSIFKETTPLLTKDLCANPTLFRGWWRDIVRAYTKGALTFGSDKLVAFEGLTKAAIHMSAFIEDDYVAGMWRHELVTDLLWTGRSKLQRPAEYRAPSWSWASVDCAVDLPQYIYKCQVVATIVESWVLPVASRLGPVKDGLLKICGPLATIIVAASGVEKRLMLKVAFPGREHCLLQRYAEPFEVHSDDDSLWEIVYDAGKELRFACLVVQRQGHLTPEHPWKLEGLALEPAKKGSGEYVRVGRINLYHKESPMALLEESRMSTQLGK